MGTWRVGAGSGWRGVGIGIGGREGEERKGRRGAQGEGGDCIILPPHSGRRVGLQLAHWLRRFLEVARGCEMGFWR